MLIPRLTVYVISDVQCNEWIGTVEKRMEGRGSKLCRYREWSATREKNEQRQNARVVEGQLSNLHPRKGILVPLFV